MPFFMGCAGREPAALAPVMLTPVALRCVAAKKLACIRPRRVPLRNPRSEINKPSPHSLRVQSEFA
jgi:hypothetical protein